MTNRTVRGEISLPGTALPAEAAVVIVQVEDVSRADAPSTVVGEQRLERVELHPGNVIPFEVEVDADALDEGARYSVRIHIDVAGSGEVDAGDLVSTQSYPVLTGGYADEAEIEAHLI
jgi:putative lipoprotein